MIQFIVDSTVTGDRFPAGTLAKFDAATERDLINGGVAIMSPLPVLIGQSYTGWTRSSKNGVGGAPLDTDYVVLASVTIPAGTMGLNSMIQIVPEWDLPNSASTKFLSVDFGGSNISAISLTTGSVGIKPLIQVQNTNSLLAQKTVNGSTYGVQANARLATAVDTSLSVQIDFKVKWSAAVASEALTLFGYSVWHYPGS